jgi:D-alanine-D-alanine ligase-like ATP-grasp enzyme
MKVNLAVIFGSRTCEHDVSIISGLQAVQAAEKAGVTPHQVRHYRERNDLTKYRRREKRKT